MWRFSRNRPSHSVASLTRAAASGLSTQPRAWRRRPCDDTREAGEDRGLSVGSTVQASLPMARMCHHSLAPAGKVASGLPEPVFFGKKSRLV